VRAFFLRLYPGCAGREKASEDADAGPSRREKFSCALR
jgi:hypothetical protein